MRDNWIRRLLKTPARWLYTLQLSTHRLFQQKVLRTAPVYSLTGSCNGCGKCCEEPSIAIGGLLHVSSTLRFFFVLWQRHINGFHLTHYDTKHKVLSFTCTHYNTLTKACDSYHSRPAMCRDYPTIVLDTDAPTLFPECSYTLTLNSAKTLAALIDEDTTLTPEQRQKLKQNLSLDPSDTSPSK